MRRKVYFVVMILTVGPGAYVVAGYGNNDVGRRRIERLLDTIGEQLDGLKMQLGKHRQTHGRYPTNDEGLAILDNFDARFTVTVRRGPKDSPSDPRMFYRTYGRHWWLSARQTISVYRDEHGRPPKDAAEFDKLFGSTERGPADKGGLETVPIELAISEGDDIFFLDQAGVLSPWFVPYVYENRNGLDQARFEGSPADMDAANRYSARVDEGVYVSSIGGQFCANKLAHLEWENDLHLFVGGGLLLVAVVFLVLAIRTSWRPVMTGAAAVLVAGVGLGTGGLRVTCYITSPPFSYRDREMVAQRIELLDKYHSKGVIGDKAYKRALSVLGRGPASQPASAPEQGEGE